MGLENLRPRKYLLKLTNHSFLNATGEQSNYIPLCGILLTSPQLQKFLNHSCKIHALVRCAYNKTCVTMIVTDASPFSQDKTNHAKPKHNGKKKGTEMHFHNHVSFPVLLRICKG